MSGVHIMMGLKLALVFLSFFGYIFYLSGRRQVPIALSPVLVLSGISLAMMLLGILNMMLIGAYLILAGGWALFIYLLVARRFPWRDLLSPVILVWLVVTAFFAWRFAGVLSREYDDFTHWMLVLKVIVQNDQLPSFRTPIIFYKAYPTGTAGFLYVTLRFVGFREDLAIFMQSVWMMSAVLPAMALLATENRRLAWTGIPIVIAALLSLYMPVSIMVDNLPAFLGMAGVLIAYIWRDNFKKAWVAALVLSLTLVFVKNSGFFFVAVIAVALAGFNRDTEVSTKKRVLGALSIIVLAAIGFQLWSRHVNMVYEAGMTSLHALNPAAYAERASQAPAGVLWNMFVRVFRQSFDPRDSRLQLMISLTFLSVVSAVLAFSGEHKKHLKKQLIGLAAIWGVYGLWVLSLWGMYAFSMPEYAMQELAQLERYMNTGTQWAIVMLLALQLVMTPALLAAKSPRWIIGGITVMIVCFAVGLYPPTAGELFVKSNNVRLRKLTQAFLKQETLKPEDKVYIYSDDEIGWIKFVGAYEFERQVTAASSIYPEGRDRDKVLNAASKADWIILSTESEDIRELIEEGKETGRIKGQVAAGYEARFGSVSSPRLPTLRAQGSVGPGYLELSWQAVPNAETYAVSRLVDGAFQSISDDVKETAFTVITPTPGESHALAVQAKIDGRWTGRAEKHLVHLVSEVLDAPDVRVTLGDGTATLEWDARDGVDKYGVARYENGKYETLTTGLKKPTYTLKRLKPGVLYQYVVLAYSRGSWSPPEDGKLIDVMLPVK